MKPIIFSDHALFQMLERGASKKEVTEAIRNGERITAKHQREAYRKNFQFDSKWANKFYHIKQVMPIVKDEERGIAVITVYTFYF